MINQMTLDKTAELSNQELSLEQLEDVQGGVALIFFAIPGGVYAAWKLGKWLSKQVGQATTNLDCDSDSGDGRDCGDGANKLSFRDTTLTVGGRQPGSMF